MSDSTSIYPVLRQIFLDELHVEEADFAMDLAYGTVAQWDSASHLILIMAIEEKFSVSVSDDDIVAMTTVAKIVELLSSRAGQPA